MTRLAAGGFRTRNPELCCRVCVIVGTSRLRSKPISRRSARTGLVHRKGSIPISKAPHVNSETSIRVTFGGDCAHLRTPREDYARPEHIYGADLWRRAPRWHLARLAGVSPHRPDSTRSSNRSGNLATEPHCDRVLGWWARTDLSRGCAGPCSGKAALISRQSALWQMPALLSTGEHKAEH